MSMQPFFAHPAGSAKKNSPRTGCKSMISMSRNFGVYLLSARSNVVNHALFAPTGIWTSV